MTEVRVQKEISRARPGLEVNLGRGGAISERVHDLAVDLLNGKKSVGVATLRQSVVVVVPAVIGSSASRVLLSTGRKFEAVMDGIPCVFHVHCYAVVL